MLPQRIRDLRKRKGISQAQLAQHLGFACKSTVSHWENGIAEPRSSLLPMIAAALDCTVGELFEAA